MHHQQSPLFRVSSSTNDEDNLLTRSRNLLVSPIYRYLGEEPRVSPSPLFQEGLDETHERPSHTALRLFPEVSAESSETRSSLNESLLSHASYTSNGNSNDIKNGEIKRTRRPPLTRLEQLGSFETWCVLLLPLLLAAMILTTPLSASTVHLNANKACPAWVRCQVTEDTFVVAFAPPCILLGHLDIQLHLDSSYRTRRQEDADPRPPLPLGDYSAMVRLEVFAHDPQQSPSGIELLFLRRDINLLASTTPLAYLNIREAAVLAGNGVTLSASVRVLGADAAALLAASSVVVRYQSTLVVCTKAAVQLLLFLGTLVYLAVWTRGVVRKVSSLRAESGMRRTYAHRSFLECLLPEQLFSFLLLLSLPLLQGAPYSLACVASYFDVNLSSDLLLYDDLLRSIGATCVLCCFVLIFDGLKHSPEDDRRLSCVSSHRSLDNLLLMHSTSPHPQDMRSPLLPAVNTFQRKTYLSDHHPCSSYSPDFYLLKIAQLAVSQFVCVSAWLLECRAAKRSMYHYDASVPSSPTLMFVLFAYSGCIFVVLAYWILFVAKVAFTTSVSLRRTRYLQTRFRQMALRQLANLLVLGVTMCGVIALRRVARFMAHADDILYMGETCAELVTRGRALLERGFGPLSGEDSQFELLLFVSSVALVACYIFSPALSSVSSEGVEFEGTSHVFVALMRNAGMAQTRAGLQASRRGSLHLDTINPFAKRVVVPRDVFCLELACFLLECSWQSYNIFGASATAATTNNTEREMEAGELRGEEAEASPGDSAPRVLIDLRRLGLTLQQGFSSAQASTTGFVAARPGRVVVSFRGSVGSTNIVSALNFAQVSLPSMAFARDSVVTVLLEAGGALFVVPGDREERSGRLGDNTASEDTGIGHTFHPPGHSDDAEHDLLRVDVRETPAAGEQHAFARSEERRDLWSLSLRLVASVPLCRQSLPRVHRGFWQSYASIRAEAVRAVILSIARHIASSADPAAKLIPPLSLCFCGHSLGGCFAVIAAYEICTNMALIVEAINGHLFGSTRARELEAFRPSVVVYTYGTPRIGNAPFAALVNSILRSYYRVEIDDDLVPRLPRFLGFYQHAGVQVLLDAECAGSLLVKPTIVESQLLRRSTATLGSHTLSRYRDGLEACFEPEELEEYLHTEVRSVRQYDPPAATAQPQLFSSSSTSRAELPDWMRMTPTRY